MPRPAFPRCRSLPGTFGEAGVKVFLRLLGLYRNYRGWLLLGAFLSLLTVLANVGLLAISGWFITAMGVAGASGAAINYFTPAAIIRALAISRTAGRYGERIITHEATFRLISALRVWFYRKIEPLAPAGLEDRHSGDLLTRIQKDVDRLDRFYLRLLLPVTVAAAALLIFSAFLAHYDALIAGTILSLLLIGGIALPLLGNRFSERASVRELKESSRVRQLTIEFVQGMADLINAGSDRRASKAIEQASDAWLASQDHLHRSASITQAAMFLLAGLAAWATLMLGLPLLQAGQLDGPQLAMLVLAALAGFEIVAPLPAAFQAWPESRESAKRLFEITGQPIALPDPAHPCLPMGPLEFRFDDVHLQYHRDAHQAVLRGVDLVLAPGSRTLLVGENGAGKSSLVNLMLRLRDPSHGRIMLGGVDLRDWDPGELRDRVAVVSQHSHLFAASIADNLRIARPDASQEQLEIACRTAQIHDFIAQLPEGYETWLGETGVNLSGGQARRIAVARALLKRSPILILDEPTEGLDNETSTRLISSLDRFSEGRTVLWISHLPVLGNAFDQCLRLDQGSLSQQ